MKLIKRTRDYIKNKDTKIIKEKIRDKITGILEMPIEIMGDMLKITIVDNKYILIEGNNKIIDYYDHYIKLQTQKYSMVIDGKNLNIQEISEYDLIITGVILNISYV